MPPRGDQAHRPPPAGRFLDSYVSDLINRDVRQISDIERPADLCRLVNLVAASMASLAVPAALANRLRLPASAVKRYLDLIAAFGAGAMVAGWWSQPAGSPAARGCHRSWRIRRDDARRGAGSGLGLELVALALVAAASASFMACGKSMLQLTREESMRDRVMALWPIAFRRHDPDRRGRSPVTSSTRARGRGSRSAVWPRCARHGARGMGPLSPGRSAGLGYA